MIGLSSLKDFQWRIRVPGTTRIPIPASLDGYLRGVSCADVTRWLSEGRGVLVINHQKGGGHACP